MKPHSGASEKAGMALMRRERWIKREAVLAAVRFGLPIDGQTVEIDGRAAFGVGDETSAWSDRG
jgi:hypothetical protein